MLEAELEEKRREQERKHEMQMQAMMFNYLQQQQYVNAGVQNPSLYGSSTRPMTLFPPTMTCLLTFHVVFTCSGTCLHVWRYVNVRL